ncbi:hypothetical protein [Arthrobacter sp. 4R501]|uniref:hypothetical protein n=1 Tax=Arthrobacter sp. 4R501 TaxID=2058886 RepID=UPI0015E457D9|nr:hypothetical protein [Arthrobacter sp. 4R501]
MNGATQRFAPDIATNSKPSSMPSTTQNSRTNTFLLSVDGTNINGAILASDGGWSAL